jgi:hypothetical protein
MPGLATTVALLLLAQLTVINAGGAQTLADDHGFDLFHPPVTISAEEQARLASGATLVKSVAPADGQVAIFSAVRTTVDGNRLARWVHRIDAMKRGKYAIDVVRFSDPPRVEDLASLRLDESDLEDIRDCKPGACGLKLSEEEIVTLAALARRRGPAWQSDVQQAFRAMMLARAQAYLAGGLNRLAPYRDRSKPVDLEAEFGSILAQSTFLPTRLPRLANYLTTFPAGQSDGVESFLYWSKEILGRKPVVSITHVTMSQGGDAADTVVVSRQVYASHYMSGSLAVTAIVGGDDPAPRYLLYLNRSRVDVLDGFLGGLVRRIVERRLRDEAGHIVEGLRSRLEAGDPP